jgi:transposase
MAKKYIVKLTKEERAILKGIISTGKNSVKKILRARALLKADESWTDEKISEALEVSLPTIERMRKHFVEEGLENVLKGRYSNRQYSRKLDGKKEAQLIAMTCSEAPEGHSRWTLHLLADRMVELKYVDSISHETVRQTLKKMS